MLFDLDMVLTADMMVLMPTRDVGCDDGGYDDDADDDAVQDEDE